MSTADRRIEEALGRMRETLLSEPGLRAEFEQSLEEFFGPSCQAVERSPSAARRHLEWFLFDRFSATLSALPAEALLGRVANPEARGDAGLADSRAAVYEVTGREGQTGLWMRDLVAGGEYPVVEEAAAFEIQDGDLVVGRLYPVGDGTHRISAAAECFRNEDLRQALHRDMERLRTSHRGTPRIAQIELERMFFWGEAEVPVTEVPGAGVPGAGPEVSSPGPVDQPLEERLEDLGLSAAEAAHVVARLRSAEPGDDVVSEALNALAFDTEVDLEEARRLLLEARSSSLASPPQTSSGEAPTVRPTNSRPGPRALSTSEKSPGEALREFDRARAEGSDLESAFAALEASLGLNEGEEDEDPVAPDFPGVVGAMVEEFLWDTAREHGDERAQAHASLRLLARYGADIGVFEELGRRELLAFLAIWIPEQGLLRAAKDVDALCAAMEAFARWSEEQHAHPLWTAVAADLPQLRESLARLLPANAWLARHRGEGSRVEHWLVVQRVDPGGSLRIADPEGDLFTEEVDPSVAAALRDGDYLRGLREPEGWTWIGCYPPQAGVVLTPEDA